MIDRPDDAHDVVGRFALRPVYNIYLGAIAIALIVVGATFIGKSPWAWFSIGLASAIVPEALSSVAWITDRGLDLRPKYRKHSIGWSEIDRVEVIDSRIGRGLPARRLLIHLRNGRTFEDRNIATTSFGRRPTRTDRAAAAINRRVESRDA